MGFTENLVLNAAMLALLIIYSVIDEDVASNREKIEIAIKYEGSYYDKETEPSSYFGESIFLENQIQEGEDNPGNPDNKDNKDNQKQEENQSNSQSAQQSQNNEENIQESQGKDSHKSKNAEEEQNNSKGDQTQKYNEYEISVLSLTSIRSIESNRSNVLSLNKDNKKYNNSKYASKENPPDVGAGGSRRGAVYLFRDEGKN